MNKFCFLLMLLLAIGHVFAQKYDNVWPGGLNEFPGSPASGNYLMRFDGGGPQVFPADLKMNFESTVAAMSDSTGKLLFYTNGCRIVDANGLVFGDGDGLNPGEIRDSTCPKNGYISPRGAMFLPKPGAENSETVLLHMGVHYDAENRVLYGPLYATTIDNTSKTVSEKNKILLELVPPPVPEAQSFEPFSVVRHGNGRDWWVVAPEIGTNRYHVFLFGENGFSKKSPVQEIGTAMSGHRPGSTVFSPDGKKFARGHHWATVVLGFDRCAGEFQDPVFLERPTHVFGGGGLAFSEDGSLLIASEQQAILSADLTENQPVLDTLVGWQTVLGISLHHFQPGPDGSLYFSSLQRLKKMPSLKNPFGNVQPTDFSLLELPVWNVRSIPYFPNFRLYDFADSPCDTLGINTPVDVQMTENEPVRLKISPNPANDFVDLTIPAIWANGMLRCTDNLGRQLVFEPIRGRDFISLDVSTWPAGIVIFELLENGMRLLSEKAVIFH